MFGDDPDVIDGQCLVARGRSSCTDASVDGCTWWPGMPTRTPPGPAEHLRNQERNQKFGLLSLTIGVVLTMAIIAML
ncbi:MAG: hypothetical protein R3E68_04625 [Burkholderiaceae bacterium]